MGFNHHRGKGDIIPCEFMNSKNIRETDLSMFVYFLGEMKAHLWDHTIGVINMWELD
jgi:hypothetical protein